MEPSPSLAVAKLLRAADEVLVIAKQLRDLDRPGDALACALFANEYIRTARAVQDMEDASRS